MLLVKVVKLTWLSYPFVVDPRLMLCSQLSYDVFSCRRYQTAALTHLGIETYTDDLYIFPLPFLG